MEYQSVAGQRIVGSKFLPVIALSTGLLLVSSGLQAQGLKSLTDKVKEGLPGTGDAATTAPSVPTQNPVAAQPNIQLPAADSGLLDGLKSQLSDLQAQLQEKIAEISKLQAENGALGDQLSATKSENQGLQSQLGGLTENLNAKDLEIGKMGESLSQIQNENSLLQDQLGSKDADLGETKSLLSNLQGESSLLSKAVEAGKQQVQGLTDSLSKVSEDLESKLGEIAGLKDQLGTMTEQLTAANSERDGLLDKLGKTTSDLKNRAATILNAEENIEKLQTENQTLKLALEQADTKLQERADMIKSLDAEIQSAGETATASQTKVASLEQTLTEQGNKISTLTADMAALQRQDQIQKTTIEKLELHRLAGIGVAILAVLVAFVMWFRSRSA